MTSVNHPRFSGVRTPDEQIAWNEGFQAGYESAESECEQSRHFYRLAQSYMHPIYWALAFGGGMAIVYVVARVFLAS